MEKQELTGPSTLFVFMDGTLPASHRSVVEFEKFKHPRNAVVEISGDGVMVTLFHSERFEPMYFKIPNTLAWLLNESDQVDYFFSLIE